MPAGTTARRRLPWDAHWVSTLFSIGFYCLAMAPSRRCGFVLGLTVSTLSFWPAAWPDRIYGFDGRRLRKSPCHAESYARFLCSLLQFSSHRPLAASIGSASVTGSHSRAEFLAG